MIPEAFINDCLLLQGCSLSLEVDVWAPWEDAENTQCVLGMGNSG